MDFALIVGLSKNSKIPSKLDAVVRKIKSESFQGEFLLKDSPHRYMYFGLLFGLSKHSNVP